MVTAVSLDKFGPLYKMLDFLLDLKKNSTFFISQWSSAACIWYLCKSHINKTFWLFHNFS